MRGPAIHRNARLRGLSRLFGICAATLPLSLVGPQATADQRADASSVASAVLPVAAPKAPQPTPASWLAGERASAAQSDIHNLFGTRSWLPPPPPPPPPAPAVVPPPPAAPRLPYAWLGTIDSGTEAAQVMLSRGDALFLARTGDVLEGTYRIDGITEHAVELSYLPLNQKQSLATETAP
ncbi:hypothetical protein ACPWT1_14930 [Ramlibacter sp. MMS24-I3-19]|uniref:hypothetical protein n=1 Tax=Ramlibacter sp. MMS24-I3-19 TaxID=3416606 RepID=UPI003D06FFBC